MGILLTMDENTKKKTNAKSLLKRVIRIFRKDDKKEKELETAKKEVKAKQTVISASARFREKYDKSEHYNKVDKNEKEILVEEIEDNEEDTVNERLQPQRSRDSGFIDKEEESVENNVTDIFSKLKLDVKEFKEPVSDKTKKPSEVCDDVIENLKNLKLKEEKEKKEKKVKTVTISRAPIVNKNLKSRDQAHPYAKQPSHVTVNSQVFSGGQVTEVGENILHTALEDLWSSSMRRENELNKEENLSLITDLINDNTNQNKANYHCPVNVTYQKRDHEQYHESNFYCELEVTNLLDQLGLPQPVPEIGQTLSHNFPTSSTNGFEQFLNNDYYPTEDYPITNTIFYPEQTEGSVYLTPPRSESIGSPLPDLQFSPRAHTSSSDYPLSSPGRLTPRLNSNMEIYQEIKPNLSPDGAEILNSEKKLKLKEFKDLQKKISASFSSNECCQKNRKSTMEIFDERWMKFTPEERKNICLNVRRLDLKAAFWVLVRILLSIGNGSDKEDLEYVIFRHICGRVLGEHPTWFLGEFGVTLLELAVMRCHGHPVLTRYLVECVRAVRRPEGLETKDCLLPLRVDSKRDNVLIACARGGDRFADVLYWLVAREPHQPPLFHVGHYNTEGYSALHVACKTHSTTSPRINVAHVLLEHGRADLWQAAHTGGDTALHLAVNSPACDLQLVLLLFSQVEQKQWKQLATCDNLGFVTPIQYARCAAKSKPNFPAEVLEFMKKLR